MFKSIARLSRFGCEEKLVLMSLFSLPTHITRPDESVLKFDLYY